MAAKTLQEFLSTSKEKDLSGDRRAIQNHACNYIMLRWKH